MSYATNTTVSVAQSKAEIEDLITRYGATGYRSGWVSEGSQSAAQIEFMMDNVYVRMTLPLPDKDDRKFILTETGRDRAPAAAQKAWEQACRAYWRSLKMIMHAKLEAIELGHTTVVKEFLGDVCLPDGRTVSEHVIPEVKEAYETGKMPGFDMGLKRLPAKSVDV